MKSKSSQSLDLFDSDKVAFLQNEPKPSKTKRKIPWYRCKFYDDDVKTRNITGRTVYGWFLIWTYLFVLYLVVFVILTGLLIIITQLILSDDRPYITGLQSPLALSPGLGMLPRIDFRTALIAYAASDPQSYMPYVSNIRTFVYLYEEVNIKPQEGFATCEGPTKSPYVLDKVCKFYPHVLELCVKENNFGYDRSQPCVILKINKVYGWVPNISNSSLSQNPLVRCRGQNSEDLEYFGDVRYYPNITVDGVTYGYFNNLYFPYLVQVAYRSPLVAVQFASPKRHVLLMVRCELFNLNQKIEPLDFQLLVD